MNELSICLSNSALVTGLAGKTSEEAMRVDEVYCLVGSLLEAIGKVSFEKDDAKKVTELNVEL